MMPSIIFAALFAALFALFTVRIRQARARAALWRNLAMAAGALAVVALVRKGGAHAA